MTSQSIDAMTAKPFSLQSAKKKGSNPEENQDFLSLMNQTMMSGTDLPKPGMTVRDNRNEVVTNLKAGGGGTDFSQNSSIKTVNNLHETQTSSGPVTEDQAVDAREAMKGFEADVKEAITEGLSITEEELTDAMNVLGLSFADLLNPANLKDLLLQVSGQGDPSVLLVSDSMRDLFLQIQSIAQEDLGQVSLDPNQWKLVEDQGEILSDADLARLLDQVKEQAATQVSGASDNESNTIPVTLTTEEAAPAAVTKSDVPQEDSEVRAVAEDTLNASAENAAKDTSEDTQAEQQNFGQNRQMSSGVKHTDASSAVANAQPQVAQVASFQEEMVSQVTKYSSIDTDDVISQIIREAKTTITPQVRTMEMELNPQNLGRMIMQVAEKNGDITARLFAQDEAVKHALENRLSDLQEKLKEAGIKVNEISIAVGTHAFEENLEKGNTQQQMGQDPSMAGQYGADESEGAKGREGRNRNLDLSGNAELPEDMTEAEALEASIMRDLGNTVSLSV